MDYTETDRKLNARTDFEKLLPDKRAQAARAGVKLTDAIDRIKRMAKDADVNVLIFDFVIERESLTPLHDRDLLFYGNAAFKGKKHVHPLNELEDAKGKSVRDEITAARKAYGWIVAILDEQHANMFLFQVLGLLDSSSPYVQQRNSIDDELPTLGPSDFDTYETAGGIDLPGFDNDQSKTNIAMSSAAKIKAGAAKAAKVEPSDPDGMDIDEYDVLSDHNEGGRKKGKNRKVKSEDDNVKTEQRKVKIKQEEVEDEDNDDLVEVIAVDAESHYEL